MSAGAQQLPGVQQHLVVLARLQRGHHQQIGQLAVGAVGFAHRRATAVRGLSVLAAPDDLGHPRRAFAFCMEVVRHHIGHRHDARLRMRQHGQQVFARGVRAADEPGAVGVVALERVPVHGAVVAAVAHGVRHEQRNGVEVAHDHRRAAPHAARKGRGRQKDIVPPRVQAWVDRVAQRARGHAQRVHRRPGPAQHAVVRLHHRFQVLHGQRLVEQRAPDEVAEVGRLETRQRHLASKECAQPGPQRPQHFEHALAQPFEPM